MYQLYYVIFIHYKIWWYVYHKQTITLFQVSMILIGSIFYSFTFYNMLTCIFIVVGPYLLGILMSIFLDIKAAKKVNPIHLFLVSTLIMIFGFYSPIFIVLSVTFGSYGINSISSQNNMKVYMVNATHRELSLLIYTTWRNMGNIFLQFFILIVIVGVGVFYDVGMVATFPNNCWEGSNAD